jgi:endo-1,4-beta-xylanase
MKHLIQCLLAASLLGCSPAILHAQTEPIVLEAESGVRGSSFNFSDVDGVQYISINSTIGGGNPTSDTRVVTFTATFPAPGTYELYARLRVGPSTFNDDSFYYGTGFGVKPVSGDSSADGGWTLANGLANPVGYTLPSDKVVGGGLAQSGVWKWVKLSAFDGGEAPVAGFVVPDGSLTQTFQIAGREDGLDLDKFAFGLQGVFYTVNDLDNRLPGSTEPPPPPFTPPGPPIATGQAKFLGDAYSAAQAKSFTAYWNQVTPENGGKWGSVEATRDVMNWSDLDTAYNLAKANGFPFKMHTLVWGNQQPAWIETLSPAEQLVEITQWFDAVAARYPDLDFIDVVNEPLHDPPNSPGNGGGNYIEALGGSGATGWDWVLTAFRMARARFPHAKLMINEFSVTNNSTDMQRYVDIIRLLQAEDLIDAVGVQGHAFSTRPVTPMSVHMANLDLLASTGLPIYISELDIDGPTDEIQLADYQRIFPVFWEHPAVQGITLWGFRPGHWRTAQGAYLVLDNGAERPAMKWLQAYVGDHPPVVASGQAFNPAESTVPGTALGNVLASDTDAGTTLTDWQINGGSGAALFTIDSATGSLSLASGASLDFESATSYAVNVSVFDGYRRSTPASVAINVANVNDNAPAVTAGQSFPIDGGFRYVLGNAVATDADDKNQPGYTTLQNWQITGGNGGSIFVINPATGAIRINRPLLIDFRKSSYTLQTTVSDGADSSAPQAVTVTIPNKVKMCQWGHDVVVPKLGAPLLLWLGGSLGTCTPH